MIGGGVISARRRSSWVNNYARRYNGTSQYDWLANPGNMNDTVGAVSFWFYVPVLLTGNGTYPIYVLADSGTKVGTAGRFLFIGIRRNSVGYGNTNNYLDVTYSGSGTTVYAKSNSTPLAAATWYHASVSSDGDIILNAATPSYIIWSGGSYWTGQWFGTIGGTNKDLAIGATRLAGALTSYGRVDVNEVIYLNAVPTSTEVSLLYNGGTPPDPGLLPSTLQAKISVYLGFENTLVPFIGYGTPTAVGPASYIAYP